MGCDSLGSGLANLGDGGSSTNGLRSLVTKGSRGDLSHDGNEGDREFHLE